MTSDYYPFGLHMQGRTSQQEDYRYGFNGKEDDTDFGNKQLIQDYGFRLYNPSISKFLSVDPLTSSYPELTPYQFASNTPIEAIDLDGLEAMSNKEKNGLDGGYQEGSIMTQLGKTYHYSGGGWHNMESEPDIDSSSGIKTKSIKWSGRLGYELAGSLGSNKLSAAIESGEHARKELHFVGYAATISIGGVGGMGALSSGSVGGLTRQVFREVWKPLLGKFIGNVAAQGGVHTSISAYQYGLDGLTYENTLGKIDYFDAYVGSFSILPNWSKWIGTAAVDGTAGGGINSVFGDKPLGDASIDFAFNFGLAKLSGFGKAYLSKSMNARAVVNSHISVLKSLGGNSNNYFQIPLGIPKSKMGIYTRLRWPVHQYGQQVHNWLSPSAEKAGVSFFSNPYYFSISGMAGKRITKDVK